MSTVEAIPRSLTPEEFFAALAAEPQPLLGRAEGTLRFDVLRGEATTPWYVRIDHGDVTVSQEMIPADAVVRVHEPLFGDIVAGRANAVAAALRGEMNLEGGPQLLSVFQRLFPGPPRGSGS